MVNFFSPSPTGMTTDIAQSGTSVKIIKRNGNFKLLKTNKPTISATIALTALPYGSKGQVSQWQISYKNDDTTTNDNLDRVDTSLPNLNPNISIYDTDIISFEVVAKSISDAGDRELLFLTDNDSVFPYSGIQVGTLLNNATNSGVIKWNPGVGNTGTYYYRWQNSSNAIGGSINVILTP
jgi:hypothetical protein